jgi:V8-like Glu-specific endopeptidase
MASKKTKASNTDGDRPTPLAYLPPEVMGPEERESFPALRVPRRLYFASPTEPRPSVRVESVEGEYKGDRLWQVLLDVGHALPVQRTGLEDRAVSPEEIVAGSSRQKGALAQVKSGLPPGQEKINLRPRVRRLPGRECYQYRGKIYRPLYIFPPDDRHVLTDSSWPWRLIGKVETSDRGGGSGALVGNRILLTARHLRPVDSIKAGNWWIKFTPHYWDGAEPFGSSFVSNNHYYQFTGDTGFDLAHDYMVCRLFDPLGEKLGFFGAQEYDEDWNDKSVWAAVGYAQDIASAGEPSVQLGCSVEDSSESSGGQLLESEADLNHGDSGGPVWAWFDKTDPRIVAVVSGEVDFGTNYGLFQTHDHDNSLAGGADMVGLIRWGRQNWT